MPLPTASRSPLASEVSPMSDKRAEGQARKAAKKAAEADKVASALAAAEDAEWEVGTKKANKKQEADADKKARAAERKAQAAADLADEEAQMSAPKAKKDGKKSSAGKKTRAEIAAEAMARLEQDTKEKEKKKKEMKVKGGNDYMGVLEENNNKLEDIDASGVDNAIAALEIADSSKPMEKQRVNLKAAYAAFEARELPLIKEAHPGLKRSQYQERVHAAWLKSPDNPKNQMP